MISRTAGNLSITATKQKIEVVQNYSLSLLNVFYLGLILLVINLVIYAAFQIPELIGISIFVFIFILIINYSSKKKDILYTYKNKAKLKAEKEVHWNAAYILDYERVFGSDESLLRIDFKAVNKDTGIEILIFEFYSEEEFISFLEVYNLAFHDKHLPWVG